MRSVACALVASVVVMLMSETSLCGQCPVPGWSSVPSLTMPGARRNAEAAIDLLGRVYIVGGNAANGVGQETATVMRLDQVTGVWSFAPSMSVARSALGVASDRFGRVYAIGGFSMGGALASVERFDPVSNAWTTIAPLPAARGYVKAVASFDGNSIFAVGGQPISGPAMSTVFRYDVSSGVWLTEAPMTSPRILFGLARGRLGEIYAISNDSSGSGAEVRNPVTGTWSPVANPLAHPAQVGCALGLPDGRILAMGGYNPGHTSAVEVYDPATGLWSLCASLPQAVNNQAAVIAADGRILLFGGDVSGGVSLNTVINSNASFAILSVTQPSGSGSLRVTNAGMPPGSMYITAVSMDSLNWNTGGVGGLGLGWWSGLHIGFGALVAQYNSGLAPFTGFLSMSGESSFSLPAGSLTALVGSTIFSTTVAFDPFFGFHASGSFPVAVTIR